MFVLIWIIGRICYIRESEDVFVRRLENLKKNAVANNFLGSEDGTKFFHRAVKEVSDYAVRQVSRVQFVVVSAATIAHF